jgi:N-acetylmuramoyl-L-alanine amidase
MTILLTMVLVFPFTACAKPLGTTEPVINQSKLSDAPDSSPTATVLPTITSSPAVTGSPTDIPEQIEQTAPTVAPTPIAYPEGEGSTDSESGILPTEEDSLTETGNISSPDSTGSKSSKRLIAIDAGHQSKGNNEKEPIGPGASQTKPKVSSGTSGIATGVPEYKLSLVISLKVKEELLNRGYEVYMIRETNDVNLSNRERAEMANESGADLFIRIHADGSENTGVSGTSTLYPSEDNPFVSYLYEDSYALSNAIVDAMCNKTGAKNRGAIPRDDMSGINWCTIPVSIIEMGYMSNKKEDKLMQTEEYQNKMVQGICDGIDDYYQ